MRKNRSSTPCIGICSTTFGDDVCKGCKRFSHEITNWGKFSTDERAVVNSRLEQFKTTILEEKFTISDSELFESKMNEFSINFNSSLEPITWIFDLLRASSNKDLNVNDFGVEILPAFSDLSLIELRDLINQEMLQLSEAHYYKFFNRAT
ncbi:MAG: DUF1289 domain-containing protein [Gammaproteobacteria bacterium]|jgi:hypothetical protein|nr:MAG: DUF1289 domain-containing protein [Gammaproteobacteria bacterium]|tara:strand:- start:101 stop:550 length:450 start_codon:yes stop_codon:yes gene_type:complete